MRDSQRHPVSVVSIFYFLIPLTLWAASFFSGILLFDELPQNIPAHFNFYGEVDRWVPKSVEQLRTLPRLQILALIAAAAIYWAVSTSRQIPEKLRYSWSAFVIAGGTVITIVLTIAQAAVLQLLSRPGPFFWMGLALLIIFMIWGVALAVSSARGRD